MGWDVNTRLGRSTALVVDVWAKVKGSPGVRGLVTVGLVGEGACGCREGDWEGSDGKSENLHDVSVNLKMLMWARLM